MKTFIEHVQDIMFEKTIHDNDRTFKKNKS